MASVSVILICVYCDFIVTFTDNACDSCEIPTIPRRTNCSTSSHGTNRPGNAHSVALRRRFVLFMFDRIVYTSVWQFFFVLLCFAIF